MNKINGMTGTDPTVEQLRKAGVPILDPKKLDLEKYIKYKDVTIKQVRKILSKYKGSLSDLVIEERDKT